jgi:indole-3-glycerol phosphate synthase
VSGERPAPGEASRPASPYGQPNPGGFLTEMVAGSRRRVAAARVGGRLRRPEAPDDPGRLREALTYPRETPGAPAPQLAVIAEVKRRSPSKGDIAPGLDAASQARAYEAAGADAVSVLTEPTRFGGSLDDLRAVTAAVGIPVLRKDFIVDKGQIWEAADAGASAVLLIVAILSDDRLHELLLEALDCGLDPLVEVHDLEETRRACRAGCTLVGINNRDLVTLEVDLATTEYLAPALGPCMFPVSESGIATPADACRAALSGARALLVGETLVRTPVEKLPQLIASLKDPGWPA